MNRSLNARFAESKGEPIELGDQTISIAYRHPVRAGIVFSIEFLSWSTHRPQGVNIRTKKGILETNEVRSTGISLWTDTAPPVVHIKCLKTPTDCLVMISNQWRRDDGVDDEWTNNAGMIIEELENGARLRCSDGVGNPTFDDLVVEVSFPQE
jgi:hypothetical protein